MNHLYFGDCLDVLKELHQQQPQPFIDLIYIDPPFNSKRNYNVLFESMDMKDGQCTKASL
jgi:site-specific DNA-methyltransferase (adenine-specific)